MQQAQRAGPGARHRAGRILPVLCVALLTIGALHAREDDNKKPAAQTPASQSGSPKKADPPKSSSQGISMDRAVKQVEKKYKARVVRTDKKKSGDRVVYELKVLSDERLWTVRVDAETGKEL